MTIERACDALALVVLAAVGILALATFRDYGLSWDDYTHSQYGDLLLRFYASGLRDQRALSWVNLYYYGGGFDLLAAAAAKALADALMNGESTVGFKQHILRSDDDASHDPTIIEIKADGVTFRSPSGISDTVYTKCGDVPVGESYLKQGGGAFVKLPGDGKQWQETPGTDANWQHLDFVESGRDKDGIRLFDSSRNMTVSLPVGGGMSQWSTDGGKTWNNLVQVDRAQ